MTVGGTSVGKGVAVAVGKEVGVLVFAGVAVNVLDGAGVMVNVGVAVGVDTGSGGVEVQAESAITAISTAIRYPVRFLTMGCSLYLFAPLEHTQYSISGGELHGGKPSIAGRKTYRIVSSAPLDR